MGSNDIQIATMNFRMSEETLAKIKDNLEAVLLQEIDLGFRYRKKEIVFSQHENSNLVNVKVLFTNGRSDSH